VVQASKTVETGGVRAARVAAVLLLASLTTGCRTQAIARSGGLRGGGPDAGTVSTFEIVPSDGQLDLLFVIDDSGAAAAQQKLAAQIPALMQVLQSLPGGLPDLHVGVVSTDLGAGPDAPAGCTAAGDAGQFQIAPRGSCAATTLPAGTGFISNTYGAANFTGPIENAVQCILPLGTGGCGFAQPLAAAARALGADGARPPQLNLGFLRENAALAIVILSAVDDCSTASGADLFKTDPAAPGLSDPMGPLTHYRCNRSGHLCAVDGMMLSAPPLGPAPGGPDDKGTEQLVYCVSNEQPNGPLRPVADIAAGIRKLKPRPDDQIAVAAIVAPAAPYGVRWTAAGPANPPDPDELWPSVMLSCGAVGDPALNPSALDWSTDGTAGEPAVRIAQFLQAFQRRQFASICDPRYTSISSAVAAQVADVARGVTCSPAPIPDDASGQPPCSVVARYLDTQNLPAQTTIANCALTGDQMPCWTAGPAAASSCLSGTRPFYVEAPREVADQPGLIYDVTCPICDTNTTVAGCP